MPGVTLTPATLRLLLGLLEQVTLTVGAPGFDEVAATCMAARAQLVAALAEAEAQP
jgi:hypothetical protein